MVWHPKNRQRDTIQVEDIKGQLGKLTRTKVLISGLPLSKQKCAKISIPFYAHRYLFPISKSPVPTFSANAKGMPESGLLTEYLQSVQCCAWHRITERKRNFDCPGSWSLVRPQTSKQTISKQEVRTMRGCGRVRTRHLFIYPSATMTQGKIQGHP